MTTKLFFYLLAILSGIATAPATAARPVEAAAETCAASHSFDAGWFATESSAVASVEARAPGAREEEAKDTDGRQDCAARTPVARKDRQRE